MLRHLLRGVGLAVLLGIAVAVVVSVGGRWRESADRGGQQPAEPFRIAGNLYYVGANDVTSFLLTGPEGHVLIDGGYPGTAPLIMQSIATLGFDIRDVRVLLNSHAHLDHAGGLAALQQASGARLWVSEGDADAVASGGAASPYAGPLGFVPSLPMFRYPAARVDRRFADGETVRLGPIALTAHVTAGHTPGCTSWTFPVRDGARELRVVHRCSLEPPPRWTLSADPAIRDDVERSFRTLRSLPVDIWVTSHAREFGRWRKFRERAVAADPVAPFIDRTGYRRAIDSAEVRWRALLADQPRRP